VFTDGCLLRINSKVASPELDPKSKGPRFDPVSINGVASRASGFQAAGGVALITAS